MRWFLIIALSTSAWAQTAPFAPPEDISFRRANIISEGTRMSAEVFAPKASADKKLSTILMAHGWGGTAALLRPDAIGFARAGRAAVRSRPPGALGQQFFGRTGGVRGGTRFAGEGHPQPGRRDGWARHDRQRDGAPQDL